MVKNYIQTTRNLQHLHNPTYFKLFVWDPLNEQDSHLKGYLPQLLSEYTSTMVQTKDTTLYNTLTLCVDQIPRHVPTVSMNENNQSLCSKTTWHSMHGWFCTEKFLSWATTCWTWPATTRFCKHRAIHLNHSRVHMYLVIGLCKLWTTFCVNLCELWTTKM